MRLIDADGLKKLTTERNEIWDAVTDSRGRGLTEIIDSMPAVDVAPVIHAYWIEDDDEMTYSNCGKHWNYCDNDTHTFNYCPNCGAKMYNEVST